MIVDRMLASIDLWEHSHEYSSHYTYLVWLRHTRRNMLYDNNNLYFLVTATMMLISLLLLPENIIIQT